MHVVPVNIELEIIWMLFYIYFLPVLSVVSILSKETIHFHNNTFENIIVILQLCHGM